jgi:hypothetical protein
MLPLSDTSQHDVRRRDADGYLRAFAGAIGVARRIAPIAPLVSCRSFVRSTSSTAVSRNAAAML